MTTGSMSLKATAKEFIPSFNISKPIYQTGGAATASVTITSNNNNNNIPSESSLGHSPLLLSQKDQQNTKPRLNKSDTAAKESSSVHSNTNKPRLHQQKQQQNRGQPRQEIGQHAQTYPSGGGGNHQKPEPASQKREPQQRTNVANKSRLQQQQQPSTGSTPGQQSDNHGGNNDPQSNSSNNSRRNKTTNAQTGRPLNSSKNSSHEPNRPSNTSTASTAAGSSSNHGPGKLQHQPRDSSSSTTTGGSVGKPSRPPAQGRSGSYTKTSAQGSNSTASTKSRKASVDQAGPGSNNTANGSTGGGSSAIGRSSTNTTTGSSTAIIPGMEATAFICLTDVIHPVRQVVKDGVSTLEQGSDAYLDWIVRSLKEYEEITLIGMEAAIPDIISLVLRAGRQGIGYQEVRTFTTQDGFGGNKSCLQFRMRRGQGYIPLDKYPPRS
ncbi:hypothetical protein FBU30_003108 [Linnemannia zychae]|nr:hypothetical protein FBU30_003108 [Linnemannia zychae]